MGRSKLTFSIAHLFKILLPKWYKQETARQDWMQYMHSHAFKGPQAREEHSSPFSCKIHKAQAQSIHWSLQHQTQSAHHANHSSWQFNQVTGTQNNQGKKHTSMSTMHTLLHLPKPEGFIMQVFRMGAQTLCICSISPWQAESHGASSKPRLMAVQQLASKSRTAKPLEGSHPAERPLDQGKASKSKQGFVLLAVSQSQGDSGLLCLYTTAAIPAAAKLQSERDHTGCREPYSWKFLTFSPAPVYAQYRKQTLIVILYSFKKGWTTVNSSPVCPKS